MAMGCGPAAAAGCGQLDRDPRCQAQFDRVTAVAWAGESFVVVGHVKDGSDATWAMARLTPEGRLGRRIDLQWRGSAETEPSAAEFHKIVPLRNGDLVIVGSFREAKAPWATGLTMRVAADGRLKWKDEISDSGASVLLVSAVADRAEGRIVAVGRKTLGTDDGTCTKWSQVFVRVLEAGGGKPAGGEIAIGDKQSGPNNRQALADIVESDQPGEFVATGFGTVPDKADGKCRDQLLVATIAAETKSEQGSQPWRVSRATRFSDQDEGNEDGFSITPVGEGHYVIAGQGGDYTKGRASAQATRVQANPLEAENSIDAFPRAAADRPGGSRFRVVVRLRDNRRLLLAGAVGPTGKAGSAAFWQIVSRNLKEREPPVILARSGADIVDAAVSPAGRVLAVGYAVDDAGTRTGWLGFVGGRANDRLAQRPGPDRNAMPLGKLERGDNLVSLLPEALLKRSAKFYSGEPLDKGREVDLTFTISTPTVIQARAVTADGEAVDLALTDATNGLIAFSNSRGSAPQMVIAKLKPGRYVLSAFAETSLSELELDVGPYAEVTVQNLAQLLAALDPLERETLAGQLAERGYSAPGAPSIALGSETVLSLLASQGAGSGPAGMSSIRSQLIEALRRN